MNIPVNGLGLDLMVDVSGDWSRGRYEHLSRWTDNHRQVHPRNWLCPLTGRPFDHRHGAARILELRRVRRLAGRFPT